MKPICTDWVKMSVSCYAAQAQEIYPVFSTDETGFFLCTQH